jgi:aspartyl-tRNA(Asn)/glutamyl-tRNA(Gln) amidotransferase subunit B
MAKLSKRMKAIKEGVDKSREYSPVEGFEIISKFATCKFDESVEVSVQLGIDAKNAANWINGNVLGYTYKYEINIQDLFMTPERLAAILKAMIEGQISSKQAKELFFMVLEREQEPADIMKAEGMQQISDDSALVAVITEVLDENTNQIEEYKNGKTNMFDYFVGQTMKKTRGQANPVKVKEILTNELANR